MPVAGMGERKILVVGDHPTLMDDRTGESFHPGSPEAEMLQNVFHAAGLDLYRDCWLTNALICYPGDEGNLKSERVDYCRPNLTDQIAKLQPDVIIPMGSGAIRSVIAPFYKEGVGKVDPWVSWQIPLRSKNIWICPTRSPRFVLDRKGNREAEVVWNLFKWDVQAACKIEGKPHTRVVDLEEKIQILYDPADANAWMEKVRNSGKGSLSFDFECNCLKPDRPEAEIVSVGLSWSGEETVAFLVNAATRGELAKLLASSIPKIGAHNKFEDRWSRAKLGVAVRNWIWDCMLSAHHLDNRPQITSVKFQAFVRLGIQPWDDVIGPYFEANGTMGLNQIHLVDHRTLLMYNGKDALVEFLIAQHQRDEMLTKYKASV